jgi:predicted Rossmann-fold nucleotide-binding protein
MQLSHDQQFYSLGRSLTDEIRDSHLAVSDLWQGVTSFSSYNKCVTVYGSARFNEDHPYYVLARQTAKVLAQQGFQVMTGGGPGIMEAANRGAKEGGGVSLGCNIRLPF